MDNLQEFKSFLMQPITVVGDTRVVNGFCMSKKDTILELYASTGDHVVVGNGMGKGSLEAINQFLSTHGLNPVAPLHRSLDSGEAYIHYGLGLALEHRLFDALRQFEETQSNQGGVLRPLPRRTYGVKGNEGAQFFSGYHKTERYAARQGALGKFLDENIDLFAQIALGKNARDFEQEVTTEVTAEQKTGLLTSVDEMGLSVRAANALRNSGVHFLVQALAFEPDELKSPGYSGAHTVTEIALEVRALGYRMGELKPFKETLLSLGGEELEKFLLEEDVLKALKKSQMAITPSQQDRYFLELIPENLRAGLKAEFVKAVLNEKTVQTRIQKILVESVMEKLGLDQPS